MERKNVRSMSLASLAVSVSAAALLGVSSVAKADDPWWCLVGNSCVIPPWDNPFTDSGQYGYGSWSGYLYGFCAVGGIEGGVFGEGGYEDLQCGCYWPGAYNPAVGQFITTFRPSGQCVDPNSA
jgi:hypothetical protein